MSYLVFSFLKIIPSERKPPGLPNSRRRGRVAGSRGNSNEFRNAGNSRKICPGTAVGILGSFPLLCFRYRKDDRRRMGYKGRRNIIGAQIYGGTAPLPGGIGKLGNVAKGAKSINQINKLIKTGKAPKTIERLDIRKDY